MLYNITYVIGGEIMRHLSVYSREDIAEAAYELVREKR
jgi:hypothetical protein